MSSLTHILDCCRSLVSRPLACIDLGDEGDAAGATPLNLTYAKRPGITAGSAGVLVRLAVPPLAEQPRPVTPLPLMELTCRHGTAAILGARELQWSVDGVTKAESLPSDRSATEVLLDLFARRVVGGLIPTPDLSDLLQGIADAETVRRVLPDRLVATNH